MNIKKILFKNKNFKLGYYARVAINNALPLSLYQQKGHNLLSNPALVNEDILERVNYYNKLTHHYSIKDAEHVLSYHTYDKPQKSKVYYHDLRKYLKYFNPEKLFLYAPGDNIQTFSSPHLVKSRPISDSPHEVIMKLNAIRHFNFIQDDIPFEKKSGMLFGRLSIYQDIRKRFFTQHFDNPLCDIGDVGTRQDSPWRKSKVSIAHHLKYKYILALEGNDVATNLKWIMSSNSIAIMPMPQYETWFMEGRLVPHVHFIPLKDDFSDLNEQIDYYNAHPQEALNIIKNAQAWVRQFQDKQKELLINLLVLDKYFKHTQL